MGFGSWKKWDLVIIIGNLLSWQIEELSRFLIFLLSQKPISVVSVDISLLGATCPLCSARDNFVESYVDGFLSFSSEIESDVLVLCCTRLMTPSFFLIL